MDVESLGDLSPTQKPTGDQGMLGAEEGVFPKKELTSWLSNIKQSFMKTYIQLTYGLKGCVFKNIYV